MSSVDLTLYLVSTRLRFQYDAAEAFVVQASSARMAKELTMGMWGDHDPHVDVLDDSLVVRKLGVVTADLYPASPAVILRSFNAG